MGVPDPGSPLGARGWRTDFPTWAGGPRWPAASSGTRSPLNNTHTQRCRTVGERKGGPPPHPAAGRDRPATPNPPTLGQEVHSSVEFTPHRSLTFPTPWQSSPLFSSHPCTSGALLIPGMQDPAPCSGAARGRRPENSFQPHLSLSLLGRTCLP